MNDEQRTKNAELPKTEQGWKERLTPEQFRVARQKGTERAFTGEYWNCKQSGEYRCAACGQPLFDSAEVVLTGLGRHLRHPAGNEFSNAIFGQLCLFHENSPLKIID